MKRANQYGIKGRQRGNSAQKDAYILFHVGVSFNLSSYRCPKVQIRTVQHSMIAFYSFRDFIIQPRSYFINFALFYGTMADDLKEMIDPTELPKHIAIIMDGNGRWAKRKATTGCMAIFME
jgi:hypothetical protein